MKFVRLRWFLCASLVGGLFCGCRTEKRTVVVFHAASLSSVLSLAKHRLMIAQPDLDIRLEPSAEQVVARKLSELNGQADLVVTADAWTIESMLMPKYADFSLRVATQELVLAYKDHSRYTAEVSKDNWQEVLRRPEVTLGRVDAELDPIGVQTLWAAELAGLSADLFEKVRPEHVARDGEELLSFLETRAVDYAFVTRNLAEDHRLKFIALPPAVNLADPALALRYAEVSIPVSGKGQRAPQRRAGTPAYVALTIPKSATNPRDAALLAAHLASEEGQQVLLRHNLRPLTPPRCKGCERLPAGLKSINAVPEPP